MARKTYVLEYKEWMNKPKSVETFTNKRQCAKRLTYLYFQGYEVSNNLSFDDIVTLCPRIENYIPIVPREVFLPTIELVDDLWAQA